MNKEEIIIWLKNNSEKSDEEIRSFIFSELDGEYFQNKESWHRHYFLEELKSSTNSFSKKVLKIINDIQKEGDGVPIGKRHIAFCIDFIVWSLLCSVFYIFPINPESAIGMVLIFLVYIIYKTFSIYKYKTTVGLYLFKIKIEFENDKSIIIKIIAREVIFLTVATGIGFIIYLIKGSYWDRITGASVVWAKKHQK